MSCVLAKLGWLDQGIPRCVFVWSDFGKLVGQNKFQYHFVVFPCLCKIEFALAKIRCHLFK